MGNVSSSVRARYENLRSLAFGGISGTYAGVGTSFVYPVRILKVTNLTDKDLLISFNGVDDMDVCPANAFYLYDYGSNKADQGGFFEQAAGNRLYAKQASGAPTSGSVYVTVVYASQV
jgi:hypothetical protein